MLMRGVAGMLMVMAAAFAPTGLRAEEEACVRYCRSVADMAETFSGDGSAFGIDQILSGRLAEFCASHLPTDYVPTTGFERQSSLDALSGLAEQCEHQLRSISIRVFGGFDATKPVRKNVVRVTYRRPDGRGEICTGVFLTRRWVMTAGHCSCGILSTYVFEYQGGRTFVAASPRLRPTGPPDRLGGFDCRLALAVDAPAQIGLDLAVFPVESHEFIEEAPSGRIRVGSLFQLMGNGFVPKLAIVGYGRTETGRFPDRLKMGYSVVRDPFCRAGYFRLSVCAMFREFVLATDIGLATGRDIDSCGGDSGGPVFAVVANEKAEGGYEAILVGITSRVLFGVPQNARLMCGGGGIYTAIGTRTVLDWLKSLGIVLRDADKN